MIGKAESDYACVHCGESCNGKITDGVHPFCCEGCKQVYLIISETEACDTEQMKKLTGIQPTGRFIQDKWNYLDEPEIANKLIRYSDSKHTHIQFSLPQIHCASCIWLLEHLGRINPAVISSKVDFDKKEMVVIYETHKLKLSELAALLDYIGYPPAVSYSDNEKKEKRASNVKEIVRIGVAGFCFSNIMMLSFPDYLASDGLDETLLKHVFSYLSLGLAMPVFFYAAAPFFIQAWKGLRQKWLNIDSPIAFAVLVTFLRSIYEIVTDTGTGYLDSMSGIVFFMLVGRWFQLKTQHAVSFERDYKSYFPMSTLVIKDGVRQYRTLDKLEIDDQIIVRNQELVPADAMLKKGQALIDYSFVTGENEPVPVEVGGLVYAGGKQLGTGIELEVVRTVSASHLTRLWNNDVFHNKKNKEESFIHPWSYYFSIGLFSVAIMAAIYWQMHDPTKTWKAITSVLIVACPCSLLLSATFTFGNLMRIFGRNDMYLKNANVIEQIGNARVVVFDKTGTLTTNNGSAIQYHGVPLSREEMAKMKSVAIQSNHPLSKILSSWSEWTTLQEIDSISSFIEMAGQGMEANVDGTFIRLGNQSFAASFQLSDVSPVHYNEGAVIHVNIDGVYKGCFTLQQQYREGVFTAINQIKKMIPSIHILSGDNNREEVYLRNQLGAHAVLKFGQSPQQKLDHIKSLQQQGVKVIMVGDGLNDAGALQQSDVGIAVTDLSNHFTPACDAILSGAQMHKLDGLFHLAKAGKSIVATSFALSIAYNIVGLSFATQALLSPLVAAILMPASSISIILLVTLLGNLVAKRQRLK